MSYRPRGVCFCLVLGFTLLSNQEINALPPLEHDPTRPAVIDIGETGAKKVETKEGYLLQAIIISSTRRLALINSKFLSVGEVIDAATVEKINKNFVVLSVSGQKLTIYLFDQPSGY
ncbi:MAG: hypothetical protein A3F46_00205 [Legionellales bacterium RIFCSPHIGHO2_12_FULL_42_9]|nr:MAG: hypothetical protein A3F46_00205 [Legionellales bacterium RIFCSPHIGHO2_12_FULL_42_9]